MAAGIPGIYFNATEQSLLRGSANYFALNHCESLPLLVLLHICQQRNSSELTGLFVCCRHNELRDVVVQLHQQLCGFPPWNAVHLTNLASWLSRRVRC